MKPRTSRLRIRRALAPALLLLVLSSGVSAQSKRSAAGAGTPAKKNAARLPPGYIGSQACETCHGPVYRAFQANVHNRPGAQMAAERHAGKPVVAGCEACHGPGAAHAQAMRTASNLDAAFQAHPMYTFPRRAVAANDQVCLSCHQTGREQMNFAHSVHAANHVGCLTCHSVHQAAVPHDLLVATQPRLCYQCHTSVEARFRLPWHHRVPEGLIQCSDCHNPHGSFIAANLRTGPAQDQVCFTCHEDKEGPFVYEHQPMKTEGCLDCHDPHGSPNPHLLKVANVNQLCLQCHTLSSFSGAPGTPIFHNQATQFQACTLCHTQIHGSNLDPAFTR